MSAHAPDSSAPALPDRHHFSHEYCLFLHDGIVHLLKSAEEQRLFHVRLEVRKKEHAKALSSLAGEDLWDWLLKLGYEETVRLMSRNQLIPALVADFCNFVFEALRSSKSGKLTVAYTLLRKPFKENLFLLELILSQEDSFLDSFLAGGFQTYDTFRPEERIQVIANAVQLLKDPGPFDAANLHALRYDKKEDISLEKLWQRSNHLVTTFRGLETEEANLNFVFSDDSARNEQWDYLYLVLPLLLYYAAEIIENAFALIQPLEPRYLLIERWRRRLYFLLWGKRRNGEDPRIEELDPFIAIVREAVTVTCDECGAEVELTWGKVELAVTQLMIQCTNCEAFDSIHPVVEEIASQNLTTK